MRALLLGPGSGRPEGTDDAVIVAPDRATALKLRGRHPGLRVVVAGGPLPVADGALDEIVDERAASLGAAAEDARVVRTGGLVVLVSDGPPPGGLAGALGGLLRRSRRTLAPTDASAWLLGAGCVELRQHTTRNGTIRTEGRVTRD